MKSRRWQLIGVVLLMTLLVVMVSCTNRAPSTQDDSNDDQGQTNDEYVRDITLMFDKPLIHNYFGKTDTLKLTAKAVDVNDVGVSRATIDFKIVEGPGVIYYAAADTMTNSSGDMSAYYVVTLSSEDAIIVTIEAECVLAGVSDKKDVSVSTKDVKLTLRKLNVADRKVAQGDIGTEGLQVMVSDVEGMGIPGIPIKVKIDSITTDTDNAIVSAVTNTDSSGAKLCSLSVFPVDGEEIVHLKAFVVVPEYKRVPTKGIAAVKDRLRRLVKLDSDHESASIDGVGSKRNSYVDDPEDVSNPWVDTLTVRMIPVNGLIDSVYIWVSPEKLIVSADTTKSATVYAVAFDENKNGVKDLQFQFSIEDTNSIDSLKKPTGVISYPSLTDTAGMATAVINTNRQYGVWWIHAVAGTKRYTTMVEVEPIAQSGGTLSVSLSDPIIYADNGITFCNVSATVKNINREAVANDTVRFSTFGSGSIDGFAITDIQGVARARYDDVGMADTVVVMARYSRGNLNLITSDTIFVLENRLIDTNGLIMFTPGTRFGVSNVDSTNEFRCQVSYSTGEPAVFGTPITFATQQLTNASFNPLIAMVDSLGIAKSFLIPGTRAGIDSVFVEAGIGQPGGLARSTKIPITIEPGLPNRFMNMRVYNLDGSPIMSGQREPAILEATLVDSFSNPVSNGIAVRCSTNVGTITQFTQTDGDTGGVHGTYTPGNQSGQARIWMFSGNGVRDSIEVSIFSGTPAMISLTSSALEISVAETGGQESCTITAEVTDANDNPVDQVTIFFLMDEVPPLPPGNQGFNPAINESRGDEPTNPYRPFPFDSTQSNAGIASVTVSSGTGTGIIQLRAWAFKDIEARGTPAADSVITVFTGLQVVAGPPEFVHVDVNELPTDGGGAIWNLEVSARIVDSRNNPVADSIAVTFEVETPQIGDAQATIGAGFTGNEDETGTRTDGVANTIMSYHSAVSHDTVIIIASVLSATGDEHTGEYEFNLPIAEAAGVLYADPRNWDYSMQPDPATFHMTCFIYDGHDHCINDGLVRFYTTRGRYYTAAAGGQQNNEGVTGEHNCSGTGGPAPRDNDDCGWANRWLRILFVEAFPDPRILETTATAEAELVGYPDAAIEPVTINMQHH